MSHPRRNVILMAACYGVFVTGTSLLISIAALVGLSIAPDPRLATVPIGLTALAAMATAMPASLLMKRLGRRRVLVLGVLAGGSGAVLSAFAITLGSFSLFCIGLALLGVLAGTSQYYRFAAADAVEIGERPRAISWVLAGGLVAAFIGPNLASWSQEALAGPPFVGSFVALAFLQVLVLALLVFVDLPLPTAAERAAGGRSLRELGREPHYVLAVLAGLVAYGTMNLLMTTTPLAMGERGFEFHDTASVIQWHVVGMFAPAFFSGRLVQAFGNFRMLVAGSLLLGLSAAINIGGSSLWHFWIALATLGVGWCFLFVAATSLVTLTYSPAEKARAQGLNDLVIFGTVACTSTFAGTLHEISGWRAMNLGVLPSIAVLLVLTLVLGRGEWRRKPPGS